MNLLTHFIAADLRRLRWAVLGWVAVTLIAVGWQAGAPFVAQARPERPFDAIMGFAWFAQLLVGAALVPLLVHGHPAVGTTAFWMTRSFPRATLATSKLVLLLLLFVAFPALCDAALMAIYRVPARVQALALLQASAQRAQIALVGAAFAVMTATFPRFVLTIAAAIAAIVVGINLWIVVEMSRVEVTAELILSTGSQISAPYRGQDPLPDAVMLVVGTVTAAAVVIVQYLRRSRVRSVSVAAAGLLAIASLGMALPARDRHVDPPEWTSDPSTCRLVPLGSTVHFDSDPIRNWDVMAGMGVGRADVALSNLPNDWIATARLRGATLQLAPGHSIESRGHGFGAVLPAGEEGSPVAQAVARLLGVDKIAWNSSDGHNQAVLLALPRAQVPAPGTAGHYRGRFAIDLSHLSVAATLPLDRTSTFQQGAHRFTLVDAVPGEMGPRLRVRMSDASPALERSPGRAYYYYLRNRSVGQALGGHQQHWGTSLVGFLPIGNLYVTALLPFSARSDEFLFPAMSPQSRAMRIDAEWMRGAELVVLKVEQGGTIERTLEIPQLQASQRRGQ